jgi:hypothetical protein
MSPVSSLRTGWILVCAAAAAGCGAGGGGGGRTLGDLLAGNGSGPADDQEGGVPNPGGQGLRPLDSAHLDNAPMGRLLLTGGTFREQQTAVDLLNVFSGARWRPEAACPVAPIEKEDQATAKQLFDNRVQMYAAGCQVDVMAARSEYELALWEAPGTPLTADEQNLSLFDCGTGQECIEMATHVKFGAYAQAGLDLQDPGLRYFRFAQPAGMHARYRTLKQEPHFLELMKEWQDKVYAPHKAEMDAALRYLVQVEGAKRRDEKHTMPPCGPELQKSFSDYVASQKPKTQTEVEQVASDPVGEVLASAAFACAIGRGDHVTAALDGTLIRSSRWLGPRSYATIKGTLEKGPAEVTLWKGRTGLVWDSVIGANDVFHRWGIVQKVEDKGDRVQITFKVVTLGTVFVTTNCWRTNRIEGITAEGRLVYEEQCAGHDEKVKGAEAPIWVPKQLATGISVGRTLRFKAVGWDNSDDDVNKRGSIPLVVEEKDRQVAAYGFAVEGTPPPKKGK